jgi:fumarylacetoacetase
MMSSTSWVPIAPTCDFSLRNLPYGIFSSKTLSQRIGVAIGEFVLDLQELEKAGIFSSITFDTSTLHSQTLNAYAALDKQIHLSVRQRLTELLHTGTTHGLELRDNVKLRSRALIPLSSVTLHLPMTIGDYTDFFVGYHHAKNVGV